MTQRTGPHQVIAAALTDWRLTADPGTPPDQAAAAAADHVELYLLSSGYRITVRPGRVSRAATVLPLAACTAGAALAAVHGDWWWTLMATIGAGLLGQEILDKHGDRR
ncbi:hypothetical protein AB0M23_31025 [Streptomyces sp. NPDC052077]|uniref:hypothetical protein n=1 Tax=Streptomyces sp. NPDC052077 TaxID=3154757 RepID=UPI003432677D